MMLWGERISLRPLERTDLAMRLEMVNDPDVQKLTTGIAADNTSENDMYVWFHMYSEDPFSEQWAIVDRDGNYLGDIDLHSIGVMDNEAWISPMFGTEQARQDKALRQEAIQLIVSYAFEAKKVGAVHIDIPDTDTLGIDVLTDIGFGLTERFEMDFITGAELLTYSVAPERFVAPK